MDCTVEITLLRDAPKKVQGVTVHSYAPTRTVWADKKSVKWGEFFAASGLGKTLTAVFEVYADEYSGESVLRWDGKLYNVERTYEKGEKVELTCSDDRQDREAAP